MYEQMKRLTQARKSDPDGIGSISVAAERGMLRRLEGAFQAFFRRCKAGENPGYPRFRPLARMETIDIVDPRTTMVKERARGYAIKPKGFPTIRFFPSRPLPPGCPLKALRIVRKPNRVYVDLVYEVEKEPLPRCDSAVGIDLGVRKRAVLSSGERIERNRRDWPEIKRQQRRVACCKRGSNRRRKRVRQLARFRYRERVRNRNGCHRATTRIVRSHGLIAVEKLNVKRIDDEGPQEEGPESGDPHAILGASTQSTPVQGRVGRAGVRRSGPEIHVAGLPPVWCQEPARAKRTVRLRSLRTQDGQGRERGPEHSQGRGSSPGCRNVGRQPVRGTGTVGVK